MDIIREGYIRLNKTYNKKSKSVNYRANIGSREAREAGFLDKEGNSLAIKKTVTKGRIVLSVEESTEEEGTENEKL